MGTAYYVNQGGFEFPVRHIWSTSIWAKEFLDQQTTSIDKNNFYILIFANRGYFLWEADYKAVVYSDFDFHELTKTYSKSFNAQETKELFIKREIKYIIINELGNDTDYTDFGNFADLVSSSNIFTLIAEDPAGHQIWQVYWSGLTVELSFPFFPLSRPGEGRERSNPRLSVFEDIILLQTAATFNQPLPDPPHSWGGEDYYVSPTVIHFL